ncbi:MAG TPA: amidohydrolase family protein [bacterium]|nr:amidohydrolase family protein [bacterium]
MGTAARLPIIDCDVHNRFKDRSMSELMPYLPRVYREDVKQWGINMPGGGYLNGGDRGYRADSWPKEGYAGSSIELVREQLLDKYNVEYAVLLGQELRPLGTLPDADYAAALAHAYNEFVIEHWLAADARLRGAMLIATQDVPQAVKEIERIGPHPGIVEVLVANGARLPYGNRYYHPIFEACEALGLPFALHTGSEGTGINGQPSVAGYGSYYVENRQVRPQGYMTHLASLIFEGVFEKFPKLRVVFIEGGYAWLAPFLWRLDADYRGLRDQTPWVRKPPSEYVWEHVRFTSQPLEEPDQPSHLLEVFTWNRAERTLMFASDYPHWDFDSPADAFPRLAADLQRRIFHDTAAELYGFKPRGATAPAPEAAASGDGGAA